MSRRTRIALIVPLVLVALYFGVTTFIRWRVDQLIEHAVGSPLPTFSLADRTGRTWTRDDLVGHRAVLHFFRSKCGACDAEAPEIRALEQALPADTVLLHVMTDRVLDFDPSWAGPTIEKKAYARPILMADQAFVDAFHSVTWSNVTPVTYVVDAAGVVRYGLRGMQTKAVIEAALDAVR
ncbi:MAG: TlpA family protein disulfide reductase [Planctomycetota bacterium]